MSNELRETIHENIRKLEEKIDKHEKLLNSQIRENIYSGMKINDIKVTEDALNSLIKTLNNLVYSAQFIDIHFVDKFGRQIKENDICLFCYENFMHLVKVIYYKSAPDKIKLMSVLEDGTEYTVKTLTKSFSGENKLNNLIKLDENENHESLLSLFRKEQFDNIIDKF